MSIRICRAIPGAINEPCVCILSAAMGLQRKDLEATVSSPSLLHQLFERGVGNLRDMAPPGGVRVVQRGNSCGI